jgi:RNA 2',3'-cyclic 3'-phosphodiesterase
VLERATVAGREHLRLFVALVLPDDAVDGLVAWQRKELGDVEDIRIVPPENLHVTIAFLGRREASEADPILGAVRRVARTATPPVLEPIGYRETRSVGMVVFEDETGEGERLALRLFKRLERRKLYEREKRPWLPHVTVLRFRQPPRLDPPVPELEPFRPSDAAVYMSALRPSGAQYEVLESVPLGG